MNKKVNFSKLRGEDEVLRTKLSVRYSGKSLDDAVKRCQKRNVRLYIAVACVILIAALCVIVGMIGKGDWISEISRPNEGQGSMTIPMTVEASKGEWDATEGISLIIKEKEPDEDEKEKILKEYAASLPDIVAGETDGKRIVTEDFSLPSEDDKYGITISWESSDPVLIAEDGSYDVLSLAEDEETVTLTAKLDYDGVEEEVSFDVVLQDDESLYSESISKRVQEIADMISSESEGEIIKLPEESGGIKLKWKEYDSTGITYIILAGLTVMLFVFMRRYSWADREIKRYREGMVSNFPPFIDKLVLLLNSGLTVTAAMEKIAADCEVQAAYDETNTLAGETAEIGRKVSDTNASLVNEWKNLATRTGINEIMRFSTIIEDNINRGTALAKKLEVEAELLRDREKKNVQQRIRLIDSKLTLPMILMLFSLVMVTVAPAMMQM